MELVREAILNSGNSSAGPDGIPFLVYRRLIDIAAPILHGILTLLTNDYTGSLADFNLARLCLIAKKNTGLVDDTRPISINNAENRLIASAIVLSIMPTCEKFCDSRQKLFIHGRKSTDHIRTLNEFFYSAEGQKKWALFLDTAKAFDSIDHSFIIETLRTQGFPQWLLNAVFNLLKDVHSFPSTSPNRTPLIPVTRGVKQGCPLSPILFALCYEPFLNYLSPPGSSTSLLAAADDICLYGHSLDDLLNKFPLIINFSSISGLGVNDDKTKLIASSNHTPLDLTAVSNSAWPKTKIVSAWTYLGILFGKDVTTSDIYEPVLDKAKARLASYRPALRSLSLYKKVLLVNTFVTTLFSYVYQFFIVPAEVRENYNKALVLATISYSGRAYKLCHLHAPTILGGLKQPLKDLWALNMQSLAKGRGFSSIRTKEDLNALAHGKWKTVHGVPVWAWSTSMRIRIQEDIATHDYLDSHSTWSPNNSASFERSSAAIYKDIVSRALYPDILDANIKKLARFFNKDKARATEVAERLYSALDNAGSKLPDRFHATQLQLLVNSIPTTWRLRMIPALRDETAALADFPCMLCGQAKDWIEHIFTPAHCPIIKKAILSLRYKQFLPSSLLDKLAEIDTPLFTHNYLSTLPLSCDLVRFVLYLSWAIWKTRHELNNGLHRDRAATRITSLLTSTFTTGESNAEEEKLAKKEKFSLFLASLQQDSIRVYTDGSANPNPGPCGAGAIIYFSSSVVRLYQPLNEGSNNTGEAWAIGMALTYLKQQKCLDSHIQLFTDSQITLGQLESGWRLKTNKKALHALQALRSEFSFLSLYKVPAHCGIHGNEEADTLANKGTSLSPPSTSPALFTYLKDDVHHGKRTRSSSPQSTSKRPRLSPPQSKRPPLPSLIQPPPAKRLRRSTRVDLNKTKKRQLPPAPIPAPPAKRSRSSKQKPPTPSLLDHFRRLP